MTMHIQVLTENDLEEVLHLERQKLCGSDELSISMQEWHARWRQEALEFYLEKAWSFGLFHKKENQLQLSSYFLAQPILFFRSMTQNLWLEHTFFSNQEEGAMLMEVAYKLSREKHLQRLLFDSAELLPYVSTLKHNQVEPDLYEVLTTKA